jgi:hypothetical protein
VAAARIAQGLGDDLPGVIDNLTNNSDEIIRGSMPTAAEAAQNPTITKFQRAMANTDAGQPAFAQRSADQTAARFAAGDEAVSGGGMGVGLDNEVEAFTRQQAARVQAGQGELPPINDTQAATMQSPAYRSAMRVARNAADDAGNSAFANQTSAIHADLRQGIANIAGTPESLAAARAARSAQAADDFLATSKGVSLADPHLASVMQKPVVQQAFQKAQITARNEGIPLYASARDEALASIGSPQAMVNGKVMQYLRQHLADTQSSLVRAGANNEARIVGNAQQSLTSALDRALPGYEQARNAYAAASRPIDAMEALQQRLHGAINQATGEVNPANLASTIRSVIAEQSKAGFRKADSVSSQQLDALRALALRADDAATNLRGLSGQGQEFMRRGLEQRAAAGGDSLDKQAARQANADYQDYVRQHSPSYDAYYAARGTTGRDLEGRQAVQEWLEQQRRNSLNAAGQPNITFGQATALDNQGLSGGAGLYSSALFKDLQRASAADGKMGASGSSTAANINLGNGLLGKFLDGRLSDTAIGAAAATGRFAEAGALKIVQSAAKKASARTEEAAIDLLLNPRKLAKALKEYGDNAQAREAFIEGIKQKASSAGRIGARVVQNFEIDQQNRERQRQAKAE